MKNNPRIYVQKITSLNGKGFYLFLFFTIVFFNGCIDEIQLDIDAQAPRIIVDGLISDSLQEHTIKITESSVFGIGNDNIYIPIREAKVKVVDEDGSANFFTEKDAGEYVLLFQAVAGKTYHVEIELVGGKKIKSHPTLLRPAPEIEGIHTTLVNEYTISPIGNEIPSLKVQISMDVDVSELPEKPYLRWRARGEYEFREDIRFVPSPKACYVPDKVDFNQVKVFDSNKWAAGKIENEAYLTTSLNYRFSDMYCFHVFQYNISKEEYDYWEKVDALVNVQGSMFDPPPGAVKGNLFNPTDVEEEIFGYFSVAGVSYKREMTTSSWLGEFIERKCKTIGVQNRIPECSECLAIGNSTTEKPFYWIP